MSIGIKKAALIVLFAALFVCAVCLSICTAYAGREEPNAMQADGEDAIKAFETSYTAQDSFVYTARARFEEGQAAGIAFGITDDGAFVLNVDRQDNRTKLMYFTFGQDGSPSASVLYEEYYIGNLNCSPAELKRVQSRVAAKEEFYIKVAVTGGDAPAVRCYIDDILRFDYDADISLRDIALPDDGGTVSYAGGAIGLNVFNSTVDFGEIYYGSTDFTRYNELYRNQYHYSPFSGWNNDPNGLVYDGEYYHLYYQTQPFQKTWGDMYWGHARSKDLVTWENLPLALLPTDGNFMWSGSAIIDKGNRSGLFSSLCEDGTSYDGSKNILIYYTVDGGSDQDQWMAYSLDGGISFIKHKCIIDGNTVENGITFRDPKVFEVKEGVWGIIIGGGQLRFYVSTNLTDWEFAGDMPVYAECPDIYKLPTDDGEKWVINAGGIAYIVGDLSYDATDKTITFTDQFGVELTAEQTQPEDVRVFDLDNANGSYATQTFYIDNANSAYGKVIGLSWFAGQPGYQAPMDEHVWISGEQAVGPDTGTQANLRSIWNGGMTFPVEYSLKRSGDVYLLQQTPIDIADGLRTALYEAENKAVTDSDANILADVSGNTLRIRATVQTQADRFGFRVFVGEDEYTEVGFDAALGYYLDRRNTASGGTVISNYADLYATGINAYVAQDGEYTFDILLDRGSLEMFCEEYTQAFYANTYAGYYSDGLEFFVESGEATVSVTVEAIASTYRAQAAAGESKLSLSAEDVQLDTAITSQTEIFAYVSGEGSVEWQADTEGVVSLENTENGVRLTALQSGQVTLTALLKDGTGAVIDSKSVLVEVLQGGTGTTNLDFNAEGIRAGQWHSTADGIVGTMSGDGFLLASGEVADFAYEAEISLGSAGAAALIFRADADMDFYYAANYDRAAGVAKVWSPAQEFLNVKVGVFDTVTLRIIAKGKEFSYYVNGTEIGSFTDEQAPASGALGLNVFNGTATFRSVDAFELHSGDYTYNGADVTFTLTTKSRVDELYNFTLQNSPIASSLYSQTGNELTLSSVYLRTLAEGEYTLLAVTAGGTEELPVVVENAALIVSDVLLSSPQDVHVSVGAAAIASVEVNGVALTEAQYSLGNGVLTIAYEGLSGGLNTVSLALQDGSRVAFSVIAPETQAEEPPAEGAGWGDILFYVVGSIEAAAIIVLLVLVIRRRRIAKRGK